MNVIKPSPWEREGWERVRRADVRDDWHGGQSEEAPPEIGRLLLADSAGLSAPFPLSLRLFQHQPWCLHIREHPYFCQQSANKTAEVTSAVIVTLTRA